MGKLGKEIKSYRNATIVDTITGLTFEIDGAYEKNGSRYFQVGDAKDGVSLKDNDNFMIIDKEDQISNGKLEEWLKLGDNNAYLDAVASKIYSPTGEKEISLRNVYNVTYNNIDANGNSVPAETNIGIKYKSFQTEVNNLDSILKARFGENALKSKKCVEARIEGLNHLLDKYEIGRDVLIYKNYEQTKDYNEAISETNIEMKVNRTMSETAKQELKIDTIKEAMKNVKPKSHILPGLVMATVGLFTPISLILVPVGLMKAFKGIFEVFRGNLERNYYKELKKELKSEEKLLKKIEKSEDAKSEELVELKAESDKLDKAIKRQEDKIDELKQKLESAKEKNNEKAVKSLEGRIAQAENTLLEKQKLKSDVDNKILEIKPTREFLENKKNEKTNDSKKDTTEKSKEDENKKAEKNEAKDTSKEKEKEESKKETEGESKKESEKEPEEESEEDDSTGTEDEANIDELTEEDKKEAKDIEEKINNIEKALDENKGAIDSVEEYINHKKEKLEASIKERDAETNPSKREKIDRRIDNISKDIKTQTTIKDTLEQAKAGLEKQKAELMSGNKAFEVKNSLKEKIANLEAKLDEIKSNIEISKENATNSDLPDLEVEKAQKDLLNGFREEKETKAELAELKAKLDSFEKNTPEQKEGNVETGAKETENIPSKDETNLKEAEANPNNNENVEEEPKDNVATENSDAKDMENSEKEDATEKKEANNKSNQKLDDNLSTKDKLHKIKVAHREEVFASKLELASNNCSNEHIQVLGIENGTLSFTTISANPVDANDGPNDTYEIKASDINKPECLNSISSNGVEIRFNNDIINNRISLNGETPQDIIGNSISSKDNIAMTEIRITNPEGETEIYQPNELSEELENQVRGMIGDKAFEDSTDTTEKPSSNPVEKSNDDNAEDISSKVSEENSEARKEDLKDEEIDVLTTDEIESDADALNDLEESLLDIDNLENFDFDSIENTLDDDYDYDNDDASE